MKEMDITEVAQRSGVPASTLRYYDEKGLIVPIGRRGLRRLFDAGVLERLALIALGRTAGFSLDEIARMFGADGQPRIDRLMLTAKADELDRTIRNLSVMRDGRAEPHGVPEVQAHLAGSGFGRDRWKERREEKERAESAQGRKN